MRGYFAASRSLYILIGVSIALLTIVLLIGLIVSLIRRPDQVEAGLLPTPFESPSETATLAGPTVNSTWTASPTVTITGTATVTHTPTLTRTPTPTRRPIVRMPTSGPSISNTQIPIVTAHPTKTPVLTATRVPFPSTGVGTPISPLLPTPAVPPCIFDGSAMYCETQITIPTVDYSQALIYPMSFPYPSMNFDKLGDVVSTSYPIIILENDSLRLAFLPSLGGRLYQIRDKQTGQDILYNNPIITPTHWGPYQMQWWLAIGGMEWAFPVEEHGYTWGLPWEAAPSLNSDGSVGITLSYNEAVRHLSVIVMITLPPAGRSFTITTSLTNSGDLTTAAQYWIDASLLAGPGMHVAMPTAFMKVNSVSPEESIKSGSIISWDDTMADWGRWRWWFSGFAQDITGSGIEIRGAGSGPGLRRDFNPSVTPGLKLFTFGPESSVPADLNGLPYFEVWGGISPTFNTEVTLLSGETIEWSETWTVIDR